jgi:hypothetical protein
MASPLSLESIVPRVPRFAVSCVAVAFIVGCPEPARPPRAQPVCAVQDCKTGEIIDTGCADDGKCISCINDCGGRVAPRAAKKP